MDFTYKIYKNLLHQLLEKDVRFCTFSNFLKNPEMTGIMLRHDVDDRKLHSLDFAKMQADLGICGTYYFRMVPQSFDEKVITEIHALGHEVGYHYEDMDFAGGNTEKAIQIFAQHLEKLRKIVPVETICMHGSPKSAYDNKDVWKKYNYRDYGIIGEPYFDIDFNRVFYLTDTGRMWDGFKVSVRDKVTTNQKWPVYHSTTEIIHAIKNNSFPNTAMINFHPQRWTDDKLLWISELMKQNAKNLIKKYFFVKQN